MASPRFDPLRAARSLPHQIAQGRQSMDRREFLWASGCAVAATSIAATSGAASPGRNAPGHFGPEFRKAVAAVEQASGGRLGLSIIDTGSGERFGWRAAERFPMCSTFKFAL